MRNHAARLGAYASDGCCEYTPDALHPNMMFCTACGCHRNFHRKVPMNNSDTTSGSINIRGGPAGEIIQGRRRRRTKFTVEQKARMADFAAQIGWKVQKRDQCGGQDEVSRFCEDIGITRQVFKIWIHNHKGGAAAGTSAGNSTAAGADWEGDGEEYGGIEGGEVEEEIKGSTSMEEEK